MTIASGRWGEVEIEKGPVDLFPTEPTDEDDLEPWVQGTPRPENEKRAGHLTCSAFVLMRKMGLESFSAPRNPVKRRLTTSTPLGYLQGYLLSITKNLGLILIK